MSEGESLQKATPRPSSKPISNLLAAEPAALASPSSRRKPKLPVILPKIPSFQEKEEKPISTRQTTRKRRAASSPVSEKQEVEEAAAVTVTAAAATATASLPQQKESSPELEEECESDSASARSNRSLELRHTHKLAERRRRKELNNAFDSLEEAVRPYPGAVLSKWDVLCEATDLIDSLRSTESALMAQKELLAKEIDTLQRPAK